MDLNPSQLDALVAIAEHGSFEAAARQLHVTPSAVSQRIRALEAAAGQVLISRGTPCRPTPHGASLVRLGRQTRLLYAEASQAIASATTVDLPVAVNADSLGGCSATSSPKRRGGTAPRSSCVWRTRRTPRSCCARATC